MPVTRIARRLALASLAVLLLSGCARARAERRVLVFGGPESTTPAVVAALRQLGQAEDFALDVATAPTVFHEDSLARYSTVVLLNTSGDSLSHRQQADLERYVQSGGGLVGVGAQPARTWPWLNRLLSPDEMEARRRVDGGRVFRAAREARAEAFSDPGFLEELRGGIRFAIGDNRLPDYDRASTARVPEANRFEQQVLVQGTLDEPTELAVARDGRVFFIERKGALKVYEPGRGDARLIERLDVYHESENGLIGLALDPAFEQTGWLYLNYSVADTLKHRVSRFTLTNEGITDEKVLLEVPFTEGCCHTGGSMTFDDRGNLLVSFGDNANPFDTKYAPIDPRPGRELHDARRSSANTQDLRGKILRITPRPDGTYTIPEGNLFRDPAVGRPEIYTMGHRNPYRISYDRRTGYLYWGEVGPDAREDSVPGPMGYDEVNQARGAGNFGWPLFIADNQRYQERDFMGRQGDYFDPARPVNESPNNTGARVLPPAQPAFIWYPYEESERFPLVGAGGRNAMAGPVYYHDDFEGSQVRLPRYYHGKLIHYDWIRGWMMAVTMDEDGDFVRMEPFLDHLEFDHPIDMQLGPDGSLYLLEYGTYWFARNPTARLSRIVYHAGNRPPTARIAAERTVGAAPLTVELSAEGSTDFDEGDSLRYAWTLGEATVEGPTARHTFSRPGTYSVRLQVRDASGAADTATTEIRVGNAPPEVEIALEGNRSFFWGAAPVSYHVEATDPEDGSLGRGIDPQRVRVTLEYLREGLGLAPASAEAGHQADRTPVGLSLIRQSDCTGCHGAEQASIGPSYRMVAERYAGQAAAAERLVDKIIQGGSGAWGEHNMPAHPSLRKDVAAEMVRYVLSLASGGERLPTTGSLRLDRHRPGESGAYVLTATYVDQARNGIGPLTTRAEVVLRAPRLPAADIGDTRFVGTQPGKAADGAERPLATAFADGAYLHPGRLDLTGVGSVRLELLSLGHDFTLELRAGGPDGELLAARAVTVPAKERWFEAAVPVRAAGERDLYLVFRSTAPELGQWNPLARIDGIRFER